MGILDVFKPKPKAVSPEVPVSWPVPQGYPVAGPSPIPAPTEQVIAMQQQGMTNMQIVQNLQRQGYQPQQIYDALAQAEARGGIEPMPETPRPAEGMALPQPEMHKGYEEVAEAVVEEKWQDFTRELGKMNEWREATNSRLDKFEQSLSDAKADLDNLHKAIVSKISEYDKNLLDVGTEIKAMEKVFQKVLPELTGSVAELSRITKGVKARPAPQARKR
jgi:hypothetical protein